MKAKADMIEVEGKYCCAIYIEHDLLRFGGADVMTKYHKGKGELRRKVIQFCAALNLDLEWI